MSDLARKAKDALSRAREIVQKAFEARMAANRAGLESTMTQLDVGLLLCDLASRMNGHDGNYRLRARRALNTAQQHIQQLTLTSQEQANFDLKEKRLILALVTLENAT